jgi:cysteine desulfurase family protein
MELPTDLKDVIYLDNAATVFPKPDTVCEQTMELYKQFGVNPGRSGYDLCLVGGDIVQHTREAMTRFFGGKNPERLCFSYNASDALNILIQGILEEGDHVISTTVEHNSVIRPINHLRDLKGVTADFVPVGSNWQVDPDEVEKRIGPRTRMVVVNHGSNVIGTIQPLEEIGKLCREREVYLVVDVAQTAGVVPVEVEKMCIDALAFTGHKSLLAPTGIGGVYVREGVTVKATRYGGTGVRSAYPYHLEEYPFRLEVGTVNVLGICGLLKAQEYIEERGLSSIYSHEMEIFKTLQDGIADIDGVTIHGTTSLENRLPVLSFTIDGQDPADTGTMLDVDHGIAARTGLQCAPLIHDQMGTSPRGTVRFSIGPSNKMEDALAGIKAVKELASG